MISISSLRSKKWFLPSAIAVITLFVIGIVVAVFLWGLYYRQWDNTFVTRVTGVIPVPAARIASHTITYREYLDGVHAVKKFLASPEAKAEADQGGMNRTMTGEDRKNVLERLLGEAALNEIADARKVTVTTEQEQTVLDMFNTSGSSTQEIADMLQRIYGWTIDDFKLHIVRPLLLTRSLEASFAADHGGDTNAFTAYIEDRLTKSDVVRYIKF
jgi:hypothetical protein